MKTLALTVMFSVFACSAAQADEPSQSLIRPGNALQGERRTGPAPKTMGFTTSFVLARPGRSSASGGGGSVASSAPGAGPAPSPVFRGPTAGPPINPLSPNPSFNLPLRGVSRQGYEGLNAKLRAKAREAGADAVIFLSYGTENVVSLIPFFVAIPYDVLTAQGLAVRSLAAADDVSAGPSALVTQPGTSPLDQATPVPLPHTVQ